MRVERYFHIRPPHPLEPFLQGERFVPDTKGGATVRVVGDTDSDKVQVQFTLCSVKDPFCRATGRKFASSKPILTMSLKALPDLLDGVAKDVVRNLKVPRNQRANHPLSNMDWSFSTKYFVAKVLACSC
jgi:hypothetical protein